MMQRQTIEYLLNPVSEEIAERREQLSHTSAAIAFSTTNLPVEMRVVPMTIGLMVRRPTKKRNARMKPVG
jgi:hypothetical protein